MSRVPSKLHPLAKISECARQLQRPYRWTYRLLMRLAARDRDAGLALAEHWWEGFFDHGAKKLVNLARLRAVHPALFERRWVSREEYDDLTARVERLGVELHAMRQRYRALAARTSKEGTNP